MVRRRLVGMGLAVQVMFAAAGVTFAEPARAELPSSVAVVSIDDRSGALGSRAVERLSSHFRERLAGAQRIEIVAAAGSSQALKAVAKAVLVTTVTLSNGRYTLVVEVRDLETGNVVAHAAGSFAPPPAPLLEPRLREALDDVVAQLGGSMAEGQLRDVPLESLAPVNEVEPPLEVQPPPPAPPDEPDEPSAGPSKRVVQFGYDTEAASFVGLFQASAYRNRADDFVGLFQLASWKNDSGDFKGLFAFGLAGNESTGSFRGLAQLGLAKNVSQDFVGLVQFGGMNRASSFHGGLQLGIVNTAETSDHEASFVGLGQIGLVGASSVESYSLVRAALFQGASRRTTHVLLGIAPGDMAFESSFVGGAQVGAVAYAGRDFDGGLQLGVLAGTARTFSGIAQVGLVAYTGNNLYREVFGQNIDNGDNELETFRGIVQAGAVSFTDHDFQGVFQLGALGNLVGGSFSGVAQVGLGNYVEHRASAVVQLAGVNVVDEFAGAAQIGVVDSVDREMYGAQIGAVNLAHRVTGVQVGLFNHTRELRGVQLGVVNVSGRGGLPVTGIFNLGF
jgi:hypothetical protein